MIKLAIAEGIIYCDPFEGYAPEYPKAEQKYLTREELDRLMKTRLDHISRYTKPVKYEKSLILYID